LIGLKGGGFLSLTSGSGGEWVHCLLKGGVPIQIWTPIKLFVHLSKKKSWTALATGSVGLLSEADSVSSCERLFFIEA